jgi:hypothetical protein
LTLFSKKAKVQKRLQPVNDSTLLPIYLTLKSRGSLGQRDQNCKIITGRA